MKRKYTREGFEEMRLTKAAEMAQDAALQKDALDVLIRADRHNWIHQTNWMGEPILQLPQDMFAFQEIIYETKPDYVIELGVAWAGSLLFHSCLMEAMGGKGVIGVDIFIPDDLRERIASRGKIVERIHLIEGSSVDPVIVDQVRSILGQSRKAFILLDSHHTHDHVLQELRIYSEFVGKGCYLICGDTIVEDIPPQDHRPRPWGPGNNPRTALREFMAENDRFAVDTRFDDKYLFGCNEGGFLRRVKD